VEVYQCDAGYVLTGQTKHTCIEGEWSGHVPSCTRSTSSGKWMYFIITITRINKTLILLDYTDTKISGEHNI